MGKKYSRYNKPCTKQTKGLTLLKRHLNTFLYCMWWRGRGVSKLVFDARFQMLMAKLWTWAQWWIYTELICCHRCWTDGSDSNFRRWDGSLFGLCDIKVLPEGGGRISADDDKWKSVSVKITARAGSSWRFWAWPVSRVNSGVDSPQGPPRRGQRGEDGGGRGAYPEDKN